MKNDAMPSGNKNEVLSKLRFDLNHYEQNNPGCTFLHGKLESNPGIRDAYQAVVA